MVFIIRAVCAIHAIHCCVNQPYWLKKNPSLLSYKGISFKTLKKNALIKEFSLLVKGKFCREKDLEDFSLATKENFFI